MPISSLLKRDGTLAWSARRNNRCRSNVFGLLPKRRQLAGSSIGGIRETQEMLDFCAEHNIISDIEVIPDPADQRSLRAHAQERRKIPLRHRHGFDEVEIVGVGGSQTTSSIQIVQMVRPELTMGGSNFARPEFIEGFAPFKPFESSGSVRQTVQVVRSVGFEAST